MHWQYEEHINVSKKKSPIPQRFDPTKNVAHQLTVSEL
jgi:hypothetical protein